MKRSVTFLIALVAVVISIPAFATTKTASIAVSANVTANCTITAAPVAFGAYDPVAANNAAGADIFANGSVTVTCTKNAPAVWIDLNAGLHGPSAVGTTRAMQGGADFLSYELFKTNPNPGPGTVWGVGNPGTGGAGLAYVSASGTTATALTVYGKLGKGQDPSAGAYADTVTATINY